VSSIGPYYHDVVLGGQYIFELERLHRTYGPIIRSKPNMVHINDPEFIDQLLTGPSRVRDKTEFFCNGMPGFQNVVAFGTQGHELHRQKRAALNAFFSKKSIRRIEPIIHDKASKVLQILRRHGRSGTPVNMKLLYTATNNDIITEYSFGKSWNSLATEDLNEEFFNAFHNFTRPFHMSCNHPWVTSLMRRLPQRILEKLNPAIEGVRSYTAVRLTFSKSLLTLIVRSSGLNH
jgi:cytochrome P450